MNMEGFSLSRSQILLIQILMVLLLYIFLWTLLVAPTRAPPSPTSNDPDRTLSLLVLHVLYLWLLRGPTPIHPKDGGCKVLRKASILLHEYM